MYADIKTENFMQTAVDTFSQRALQTLNKHDKRVHDWWCGDGDRRCVMFCPCLCTYTWCCIGGARRVCECAGYCC